VRVAANLARMCELKAEEVEKRNVSQVAQDSGRKEEGEIDVDWLARLVLDVFL